LKVPDNTWSGPVTEIGAVESCFVRSPSMKKQLVLDHRPAKAAAELGALERCLEAGGHGQIRGRGAVTEKIKRLAVEGIGPRASGHVDRAGRGQVVGKVQRGPAELELLECLPSWFPLSRRIRPRRLLEIRAVRPKRPPKEIEE